MTLPTLFTNILLVILAVQFKAAFSYNIEVNKVGISRGEKGSQFGYTVAIVRKPGWNDLSEFYDKELLVGAPNTTYNNIKGHGQVLRCAAPTDEIPKCTSLNLIDTSNFCDRLSRHTDTDCATDSRLGATMAVNRKFPDIRTDTSIPRMPMVTVCAPGWKNVYPAVIRNLLRNFVIGMCLKMRDDFKPIKCTRKYCWPFWPTYNTTSNEGRPAFTQAQAGMSAAFTLDGRSEIIGAPGADDRRGAYMAIQENWLKRQQLDKRIDTTYFGYALTSGRFVSDGDLIVSGTPNWHDHFGKVGLFKGKQKTAQIDFGVPLPMCAGQVRVQPSKYIDEEQIGSKFGAALEAVDLTGDGYDELLVGAPLYTGDNPEEGRVFVYSSTQQGICGPIGILSGSAKVSSLKEKSSFARFGTAIASAGDLDQDGYNDVAIGAPNEDDGAGTIYIYQGIGQCDCEMEDKFSQRITGRDVDIGIRSFGWSIYGNEDIDDNSFPDLAVGAYESDTAVVLRTRPIVNVEIEMKMSPNPIPLNGSLISCSVDGDSLCFEVQVQFKFNTFGTRDGNVDDITLRWTLDSDTVYKDKNGWSRVQFRGYDGKETLTESILLRNVNRVLIKTYVIDVKRYRGKPEPDEPWTIVRMEGSYELAPTIGNNFAVLDPILHKDAKTFIAEDIEFDKKCDGTCNRESDLKLAVEMFLIKDGAVTTKVEEETVLYIGAADTLQVISDIENQFDTSFKANISADVTAVMKRDVSSNDGVAGGSCRYTSPEQTNTTIYCKADTTLETNENMKIKMYFDVSRQRLIPGMDIGNIKEFLHIAVKADQANKDVNMNNNEFEQKIAVKLKYHVVIHAGKETSIQERYRADENSTGNITINHRYHIINEGPSFMPKTNVNITIPYSKDRQDIAIITDMPSKCIVHDEVRIERQVEDKQEAEIGAKQQELAERTGEKTQKTAKDRSIMCEEYTCAIVECEVPLLENKQQHDISFTMDIYEKELARQKEFREISYVTRATMADPFIWYGEKVVPWDKAAYAEKLTKFIVETPSVVSEAS